jgi:hypothetical protein
MTCVEKRVIFLRGGCLQFGRVELGWERRRRNRGGESRQSGDILTFFEGLTDRHILSVISLAILSMNWSHQCTEIRV